MNSYIAKFNLVKTDIEADTAMVQLVAQDMETKLEYKRDELRGGWWDRDGCSNQELSMLLEDHVAKGHELSGQSAAANYIDICNLSAMLATRSVLYGDDA